MANLDVNARFREVLALRIHRRNNTAEFAEGMELISAIASAYGARPIDKESKEGLWDMCMTIYEAGKISGIRSERERKEAKAI